MGDANKQCAICNEPATDYKDDNTFEGELLSRVYFCKKHFNELGDAQPYSPQDPFMKGVFDNND